MRASANCSLPRRSSRRHSSTRVVPVHDAGEMDGQLYLAMRYVEGSDLKTLIAREGGLAPPRALALCAQVATALDAAHARGLVHRDVKPSNVLLDPREHVYLAHFGADSASPSRGSRASMVSRWGLRRTSRRSRFGVTTSTGAPTSTRLGCVLYECLTGQAPFRRDSELVVLWSHLEEPPPKATDVRRSLARRST